jgi:hypothetical protein
LVDECYPVVNQVRNWNFRRNPWRFFSDGWNVFDFIIVAVCFLLGFAASFVIAGLREFRFHREIGRLKKAMRAKDREIADLRTMPLSDQPVAGGPVGSERDVEALPGPPEGAAP